MANASGLTTTTMNAAVMAAADDCLCHVEGTSPKTSAARKWQRRRASSQLLIELVMLAQLSSRLLFFMQSLIIVILQLPMSLLGLTWQRILPLQSMCVSNLQGCWDVLAAMGRLERNHLARNKMQPRWFWCLQPHCLTIDVPSRCKCACLLGIVRSTLDQVDGRMIKKRQQLTVGERIVLWALLKAKKEYLTISSKLKVMLLNTFNDHPHFVVLPNTNSPCVWRTLTVRLY